MSSRKIFTRRFLFGFLFVFLLTGLNAGLFWYARKASTASPYSFVEKSNGIILLGRIKSLDGGYLELNEAYTFHEAQNLQGVIAGGEFRVESLNPNTLKLVREEGFDGLRIGPSDIKQWGDVPLDSTIGKQLIQLVSTQKE